jgi:energy-coupling factor transporter ATP-binding protein EcfA2
LEHLLKTYRNRLINLSTGNKSLLHLRISKENEIDCKEFDFLNNESVVKLLEKAVKGNKILLCAKNDSRNEKNNQVSVALNKIYRKEKFIAEERGTNDLFIGFPYVEGKFANGNVCRCPLLYFPVSLQLSIQNNWELQCTDDFFFNKSFLLAYAHYNDIKITDDLLENVLESIEITDFISFLTSLYTYLKESPLEINFNRELFEQQILFFQDYKKADLDTKFAIGELKLIPNAVLGIFPKTDSYLTPDYDELLNKNEFESLEHLLETRSPENNAIVKEEGICTAFPIDASQEKALIEIKKGKSVVMQGPPGSGKSQLICNLISDFTSKGKKVLVVSQKRAALDVVEARLKEKNIENFIVNIHDFRTNRKALYTKLEQQIEWVENYKKQNATLDAIQLERDFVSVSRKIESIVEEIDEFKSALFSEKEFGISVKKLYLTTQKTDLINSEIASNVNIDTLNDFLIKLNNLVFYSNKFPSTNFENRRNLANIRREEIGLINKYSELLSTFQSVHFSAIFPNSDFQLIPELLAIENLLHNFQQFYTQFPEISTHIAHKDIAENELNKCFKLIFQYFSKPIELELPIADVQSLIKIADEYLEIESNIFKKTWWNLTSNNKRVLQNYIPQISNETVNNALLKLKNRVEFEKYIITLKEKGWAFSIETNRNYYESVKNTYTDIIQLKDKIKNNFGAYKNLLEVPEKWQIVLHSIEKYKQIKKESLIYYSESQIESILMQNFNAIQFSNWIEKHFDLLIESDKIIENFTKNENQLFQFIKNNKPEPNQWNEFAENSIKSAWIVVLEEKYPILNIVSTGKIILLEKELQHLLEKKNALSTQIWQIRLRENTYRELKHNRLMNTVTYRDLKHQVAKKRSIWPVRKLLSHFSEEIFNLTPCWLASPETVSAVFPLLPLFDLVIFDEASQCFAEKGIPAIYRGKQVVIAGDSKQLQPSDLYQVRWEQEDDEAILEIDSLLELCRQFLPEFTLKGHYRSSSFDLIAFSNKYFYNNQLQLIPHIDTLNNYHPAIEYIKVDGIWKSNTNEEEAYKVVELAFKLLADGIKDFGIVTFNIQQQQLIQDLLDKNTGDYPLPEKVFVKNIENIQGDERDIIIFSVGYAPDSAGRFSAQFGSLNQQNGENRLNVAITRAKNKILIVSSIYPSQLEVGSVMNEGPKYFKSYLEYALKISNRELQTADDFLWAEKSIKSEYSLINKLEDLHKKIIIPFSDLAETKQNKYQNLIYTDDNRLFQTTSKEFFAYLPLSIAKMGWQYSRHFSRNYFYKN